jgi:hypothetical protein
MIAQRKPNLDKGFEELHAATPDTAWKAAFLTFDTSNKCSQQASKPRQRWFLPTFDRLKRCLDGPRRVFAGVFALRFALRFALFDGLLPMPGASFA